MSKLILTRGVPASGKTTYAKQWVQEDPLTRARLNRDDFRAMLFAGEGVLNYAQEKTVSAVQQAAANRMLAQGIDVIVDDTNLAAKFVKLWYGVSRDIEFIDFPIDAATAIERDFQRGAFGGRSVGHKVIRSYFDRFIRKDGSLPPAPINPSVLIDPEPYRKGFIRSVSFDLDGTLAHMNGRSPYDDTQYLTDDVDVHVRELLRLYAAAGYLIIILTARKRTPHGEADTIEWLKMHQIHHDALFMRDADDDRNDSIVKSEIVDKHISGYYDIRMHFDDRNRVVDALRDKGIKVAQVNPGNF